MAPPFLSRLALLRGWVRALALACTALVCALPLHAQEPQEIGGSDIHLDAAPDLAALVGKPVKRIDVIQTGTLWHSTVRVDTIRIGEPLNPAAVRQAARELLNTARFANVAIDADADGDGVALKFTVTPRRLVAARRLVGAAFDENDVWNDTSVRAGGELTEAMLARIAQSVRIYHTRRGYPDASARIETRDTDDPMRVVVVVEVTPGSPHVFANRQFIVPSAAVRSELEELASWYGVGPGDPVDETQLEESDRKLEELLRARSWASARVTHRSFEFKDRFYLYVYVTPGPRTRLKYEGNHRFDADQLTDATDYDKETDRTPAHLATKIVAFYRSVGLYDATVSYELRGGPSDLVQDLVFKIREGAVVRVATRTFPCLTGLRGPSEVASEIDSFLEEELPGGGLFAPVDPGVVDEMLGPHGNTGTRPAPMQLDPSTAFVPTVYEKALKHLQDLFRSEGYLSATVGPVQMVRRACDRRSPPGQCIPVPLPSSSDHSCRYDARGLPLDEPELDPGLLCRPDHARGLSCEPNVHVRIPVKLGPRATLYDMSFEGNRVLVENQLAEEAGLQLGAPASNLELEQARRRVIDAYRDKGFAYAEVRASLDLSPDRTRARARFTINESEQVFVDSIIVEGAERTSESLILGRAALRVGQPYRQSLVRKTEERIATLGVFSTVSVSLQDPYVPARRKIVVIHVQERLPQYLDIRPGFSTGEGFRAQFEYGHRNIAVQALQITFRIRLAYLPDPFILDPQVRVNLDRLPVSQRMQRMNIASLLFPEIGLGPLISLGVDGIDVRSNARDFGLSKDALGPALNYRPVRTWNASLGLSLERNDVSIFNGQTVEQYLSQPGVTTDLGRLLRVPDGLTYAVAERLTTSWDRRDIPFGATKGTLLGVTVEHVRAFPASDNPKTQESDFLRTSGVAAGYIRLSKRGLAFAVSVRGGAIQQLMSNSKTYPDRLFFLGGVDSIRGFLQDSVVPQDLAQRIIDDAKNRPGAPSALTISQVAIRGGDVFINPRFELRVPLSELVQTALFLDTGNVWVEPINFNPFILRYAAGSGLRINTPIGPIAFDYGINLARRAWEDFGAFHFSIGLF